MPLHISNRANSVEPFLAMDVMSAANKASQAGRSIMRMEVGQPSAPAPGPVREAAERAAKAGKIGYTDAGGLVELKEAISQNYHDRYGLNVPANRVLVTTGSSAAFNLAFLAAFDPGDRVALASPGYPAYRNIFVALGIEVIDIPVDASTRWALTADHIREAHRLAPLAGVLVASPANPTGTITSREDLRDICAVTDELGIRFISDEIYHGLEYDVESACAQEFSDSPILINSFSKYYCMTGWRIGWMVLPQDMIRPCERLAQSLYISPPEISQRAAISAFDATDELEDIKRGYRENRAFLTKRLPEIGLANFLPADGAFYFYVDVSKYCDDSLTFASQLLEHAGVAVGPGADFDTSRGHKFIRLSFAGSLETMHEAMARLHNYLGSR